MKRLLFLPRTVNRQKKESLEPAQVVICHSSCSASNAAPYNLWEGSRDFGTVVSCTFPWLMSSSLSRAATSQSHSVCLFPSIQLQAQRILCGRSHLCLHKCKGLNSRACDSSFLLVVRIDIISDPRLPYQCNGLPSRSTHRDPVGSPDRRSMPDGFAQKTRNFQPQNCCDIGWF